MQNEARQNYVHSLWRKYYRLQISRFNMISYSIKLNSGQIWEKKIFCPQGRHVGGYQQSLCWPDREHRIHYSDVIMMVSQITGDSIVYSSVCSGADQRKHQSSASLSFVRRIHQWPVNSPHKGPVTRKIFPYDDVIMITRYHALLHSALQSITMVYSVKVT